MGRTGTFDKLGGRIIAAPCSRVLSFRQLTYERHGVPNLDLPDNPGRVGDVRVKV